MKFSLPRPFIACAGLLLLSAFTACSRTADKPAAPASADKSAPGGTPVRIGFIVKQPEVSWFQLEWKFADQAAKELGFNLTKIGAPDGEKVLAAIDNLAALGAQGFVICTPDARLGPAIVNRAQASNLKLMTVDDQFLGADGKPMTSVHHLGISATKIGETVGAALADLMKKRGWTPADTAAFGVTFDELNTAKERTDGARAALVAAGFPADHIFNAPERTSDIPGGFDATNILLTQQAAVKHWLVFGMNDWSVLGAVRALEGRGFAPESCVAIGINGTDCIDELEKQKATSFYGSILLSARQHGYETAKMMYRWIKDGVEPPLDTRTAGVLITRENFRQVLKEQGLKD